MMVFEVSGSDSMGRFIDGYCAELSATLWNDIINIVTSLLKPLLITLLICTVPSYSFS